MSWLSQALRKIGKTPKFLRPVLGNTWMDEVGTVGGFITGGPTGAAAGRGLGKLAYTGDLGEGAQGAVEGYFLGRGGEALGFQGGAGLKGLQPKAGSILGNVLNRGGSSVPSGELKSFISTRGSTLRPGAAGQALKPATEKLSGFAPHLLGDARVPNFAAIPHPRLGDATTRFSGPSNLWEMVGMGNASTTDKLTAISAGSNVAGSFMQGQAEEAQLREQAKQRAFENDIVRQRMLNEEEDRKRREEEEARMSQLLGPILQKLLERAQMGQEQGYVNG